MRSVITVSVSCFKIIHVKLFLANMSCVYDFTTDAHLGKQKDCRGRPAIFINTFPCVLQFFSRTLLEN